MGLNTPPNTIRITPIGKKTFTQINLGSYGDSINKVMEMKLKQIKKKNFNLIPYPKEIRDEIGLKHTFDFNSRSFPSKEATEIARKQRNKVTKLLRNYKKR